MSDALTPNGAETAFSPFPSEERAGGVGARFIAPQGDIAPEEVRSIPDIADLTLEQKVGQVLCFGWDGDEQGHARTINAHARLIVEELGAGSIIVMGRNVGTPEETRQALADLQSRASIPLFVAVDQEGGSVNRFGPPFTAFPGNMATGAAAEHASIFAFQQARAQAQELAAIGVNWNFAPVLDVNNNPDNPIIGIRSYSSDPTHVADLGSSVIDGYQQNGLLACAKHFPGHGDTGIDSHHALPVITGDRDRLDAVELVPFQAAIASGVGAIMTTHILFPALDPINPATLSPAILTDLLRQELGYNGIVITDCLEMDAIGRTVGTANGAVQSLKAGADVVLVCHTLSVQRETYQAILDAVHSGELPEERLNEAVGRVLDAKRKYITLFDSRLPADPWNDPAHAELQQNIARRSITIVRQDEKRGVRLDPSQRLAVVSAHSSLSALVAQLQHQQSGALTSIAIPPHFPGADVAKAFNRACEIGDRVLVATSPPEPWTKNKINVHAQAQLVHDLHRFLGSRLIVVALREPYDLRHFPQIENYVCTYGTRPCSLAALADALYGLYEPIGKLPVEIPLPDTAS